MTSLYKLCLLACLTVLPGCIFASVTTPYDTDLEDTKLGARVGESNYHCILGLVAWGDAGTQAAAEDGSIQTIRHMDRHVLSILLFVYYKQTTIVYGD